MLVKVSFLSFITFFFLLSFSRVEGWQATEFTQILNRIQMFEQTINQVKSLYYQAQQIQHQVEQLKSIRNYSQGEWANIKNTLFQLDSIVRQGQGLSYTMSSLERKFREMYPGYKSTENYQDEYKSWSTSTLDSIKGSLLAANLQSNGFQSENAAMLSIQNLSDSAVGQTQAVQAGNMISNQVVQQIQKLRQLIMSQMQAQNAYMSHEINNDAVITASEKDFFQSPDLNAKHNNYKIKDIFE